MLPVQLYLGSLWFTTVFLRYAVDGVARGGGAWRVGWDGFQWGARWFSAKVNKELSYHTICCLWSVTHGFWTAASVLPACLFWMIMVQRSSDLRVTFSKYIQRDAHCVRLMRRLAKSLQLNNQTVKATSNTQRGFMHTPGWCVLESVTEALYKVPYFLLHFEDAPNNNGHWWLLDPLSLKRESTERHAVNAEKIIILNRVYYLLGMAQ